MFPHNGLSLPLELIGSAIAAFLGEPGLGVVDRTFAALNCDIGHCYASLTLTLRGSAVSVLPTSELLELELTAMM